MNLVTQLHKFKKSRSSGGRNQEDENKSEKLNLLISINLDLQRSNSRAILERSPPTEKLFVEAFAKCVSSVEESKSKMIAHLKKKNQADPNVSIPFTNTRTLTEEITKLSISIDSNRPVNKRVDETVVSNESMKTHGNVHQATPSQLDMTMDTDMKPCDELPSLNIPPPKPKPKPPPRPSVMNHGHHPPSTVSGIEDPGAQVASTALREITNTHNDDNNVHATLTTVESATENKTHKSYSTWNPKCDNMHDVKTLNANTCRNPRVKESSDDKENETGNFAVQREKVKAFN